MIRCRPGGRGRADNRENHGNIDVWARTLRVGFEIIGSLKKRYRNEFNDVIMSLRFG